MRADSDNPLYVLRLSRATHQWSPGDCGEFGEEGSA
jgi:hypothetical protein